MNEAIHAPRIFRGKVLGYVKTDDLTRHLTGKGTGIEARDTPDTGFPCHDVLPCFGNPYTDGRYCAQSGHYNSAPSQTGLRYGKKRLDSD